MADSIEKLKSGIEQWKTCVDMANKNSEKRNSANALFVTINSGLIAAISVVGNTRTFMLAFVGVFICWEWKKLLRSYAELNCVKYEIINKIEEDLPYKPFSDEWAMLQERGYVGLCSVEGMIPWVFIALYLYSIISELHTFMVSKFICGA